MNFAKRFLMHGATVVRHRSVVRKLCFKCGLYWQGITHDLSKYSPIEFWNGVKYFSGKKSPHENERSAKGYSMAWLHHKGVNKHHPDYWVDLHGMPVNMPIKLLFEMVIDRVAACKIYLKNGYSDASPYDYYIKHADENKMSDYTREQLEFWLKSIKTDGLNATLSKMKEKIKK